MSARKGHRDETAEAEAVRAHRNAWHPLAQQREGSLGFRDALRVGRGDDEVVLRALAGEIEAQACKAGVSQRLGKVLVEIADLVLVAVPTMDEQHGAPRVT